MQRLRLKPDFTTLLALLAGLLLFASPLIAEDTPTLQMAPVNPAFTDFMLHVPAVQSAESLLQSESKGLGYIPSPVNRSHLKGVTSAAKSFALQGVASLPASYDLRTLNRVTPVRDQGNCGSCWTFGTMASLESALMPAETRDFSENNLKNTAGFDWGPCDGGNADMSTAYLMRWSGPINESDDPYSDASSPPSPPGLSPQKHEQNVIRLPLRTGSLDNDTIKSAVMSYGALYVSIYYYDETTHHPYYNAANHAYYYNGSQPYGNHAVAIVGWDDSFPKSNFPTAPPGNGAFIIKNSWGTGWGENGYFYISYYDTILGYDELAAFTAAESTTDYTRVYSYDPLGVVGSWGYGSNTAWFANLFTAQGTEQINAVSFYNSTPNAPYEVYVYKDLTNAADPRSGTLLSTETGTLADAGYLTIPLATPAPVATGDLFSVVVKLTTPGYNNYYPIPVEYDYSGYSSKATASPGQSFTSSAGTSWSDTTKTDSTMNVCIKAYALSGTTYGMSGTLHAGGAAGPAIAGAQVSLAGKSTTTDSSGTFTITGIATGTYTLRIAAAGYSSYTDSSYAVNSDQSGLNFFLTPVYTMSGTVRSGNAAGRVISGAQVSLAGKSAVTNSSGAFSITGIAAGSYNLSIAATGYSNYTNSSYAVNSDQSGLLFYPTLAGSVIINKDSLYTKSRTVTLALSSPAAKSMRLGNDGSTWGTWTTYAKNKTYTLPLGDGVKTVFAQFRDAGGSISPPFSDSITLDTTKPTGSITISGNATSTPEPSVTLTLSADDHGGSGVASMRFSRDNITWSAWEPYAETKSMTFHTLGKKTVYVRFKDNAGNVSSTRSISITLAK